jgi:oligopeptidase B
VPGVSLVQRDRNTNDIYLGYSSPKTPSRVYLYNLENKSKKLVQRTRNTLQGIIQMIILLKE